MSIYKFEPGKPKPKQKQPKPSEKPATASKQKPRLKITVQHSGTLDELSQRLGLSKASVYNLALSHLAEEYGMELH